MWKIYEHKGTLKGQVVTTCWYP